MQTRKGGAVAALRAMQWLRTKATALRMGRKRRLTMFRSSAMTARITDRIVPGRRGLHPGLEMEI